MPETRAAHIPDCQIDELTTRRSATITELAAVERRYLSLTVDLATAELDRLFSELHPHLLAVTYAPDEIPDLVLGPEPPKHGDWSTWEPDQGRIDLEATLDIDRAAIEQIFTVDGHLRRELTREHVAAKTRALAARLANTATPANSEDSINHALAAHQMHWATAVHQATTPDQRALAVRRHDELVDLLHAR